MSSWRPVSALACIARNRRSRSAAIAAAYAFIITFFVYRQIPLSEIVPILTRSMKTLGIVMILIGFAAAFGHILTMLSLPLQISNFFTGISDNPYVVLLAINVLLLIVGMFMETIAALIITRV